MYHNLTNMAADMTGADALQAGMVAGIATRCAYSGVPTLTAETIVYDAMFLAQRNGHTALPRNAEKMVAVTTALEATLKHIKW